MFETETKQHKRSCLTKTFIHSVFPIEFIKRKDVDKRPIKLRKQKSYDIK